MEDYSALSNELGMPGSGFLVSGKQLVLVGSKRDACITLSDTIAGFLSYAPLSSQEGIYKITDAAIFRELANCLRKLYGAKPSLINKSLDLNPLRQAIEDASQPGVIENPHKQNIHSIDTASYKGYFQYLRAVYKDKRITGFFEVLEQRVTDFYDYLADKVMPMLSSGWPVRITSFKKMESSLTELERKLAAYQRDVVSSAFKYVSILNMADAQLTSKYEFSLKYAYDPNNISYFNFTELEKNISCWEGRLKSIQKLKEDLNSRFYTGRLPKKIDLAQLDLVMFRVNEMHKTLVRRKTAIQVFNRAYETDNQAMLSKAAGVLVMSTLSDYIHPVGNNITAYAGVLPAEIGPDRSWSSAANGVGSISPEEYAKRIYSIITEGYRPSHRQVNGKVMGMTDYMNIYFFNSPHEKYGGYICLVSWPCKNYCVFDRGSEGNAWEQYILTKKNIDPRIQTVYIGTPISARKKYPNTVLGNNYYVDGYIHVILSELKKMGLKAGRDFVLRDL